MVRIVAHCGHGDTRQENPTCATSRETQEDRQTDSQTDAARHIIQAGRQTERTHRQTNEKPKQRAKQRRTKVQQMKIKIMMETDFYFFYSCYILATIKQRARVFSHLVDDDHHEPLELESGSFLGLEFWRFGDPSSHDMTLKRLPTRQSPDSRRSQDRVSRAHQTDSLTYIMLFPAHTEQPAWSSCDGRSNGQAAPNANYHATLRSYSAMMSRRPPQPLTLHTGSDTYFRIVGFTQVWRRVLSGIKGMKNRKNYPKSSTRQNPGQTSAPFCLVVYNRRFLLLRFGPSIFGKLSLTVV